MRNVDDCFERRIERISDRIEVPALVEAEADMQLLQVLVAIELLVICVDDFLETRLILWM